MTADRPDECPRCSRALHRDAFACGTCAGEAHKDLLEVAYFLEHIDEKRARVKSTWRFGSAGRTTDRPLPFDARVAPALKRVLAELARWATATTQAHPDHDVPPKDPARLAEWLAEFTDWMTREPWAHDAFDGCAVAHETLKKLFDNPPEQEAIGTCGALLEDETTCTEVLAADKGAMVHRCPRCGAEHDVRQRREQLIDQAADFTVTVAEAVRMLRTTERQQIDARLVRALIRHVPIAPAAVREEVDIRGRRRPVDAYRLGAIRDALNLMEYDRETQKAVRRVMRGARDTSPATLNARG